MLISSHKLICKSSNLQLLIILDFFLSFYFYFIFFWFWLLVPSYVSSIFVTWTSECFNSSRLFYKLEIVICYTPTTPQKWSNTLTKSSTTSFTSLQFKNVIYNRCIMVANGNDMVWWEATTLNISFWSQTRLSVVFFFSDTPSH